MLEYQASKVIGVDIEGTDRIKIQCKNHANYCSIGTINEIKIQSETDIPVLVTKGIRMEAMAVLPFEKLVTLLEIAYGLELPFRTFGNAVTSTVVIGPDRCDSLQPTVIKLLADKKISDIQPGTITYSDEPRTFKEIEAEWVQDPKIKAQIDSERAEWEEMQREIAEMEAQENDHSDLDALI